MRRLPPARRRVARGQITWVTLFLLAILGGAGYLAWVWIPLQITHFQAKQVVREHMNRAVRERNDELLRTQLLLKLRSLATVSIPADGGRRAEVPAVDVPAAQLLWERDAGSEPPTLRVALAYTRMVEYPLLDRVEPYTFEIDLTTDISVPDWGPAR